MVDDNYFEIKQRKISDQTLAIAEAYEEKRQRLASLWSMEPNTTRYRQEIKALCACREPWVDAGCCVHGLGITVYSKEWNPRRDL